MFFIEHKISESNFKKLTAEISKEIIEAWGDREIFMSCFESEFQNKKRNIDVDQLRNCDVSKRKRLSDSEKDINKLSLISDELVIVPEEISSEFFSEVEGWDLSISVVSEDS